MPAQSPFGHLLSAVVTPMRADGSVDTAALAALVDYLIEAGHDGIVVNGTTGEAPTLSDAEMAANVACVKEAAAGRATVVAGVGTNGTEHTLALAEQATKAGADALLVVTPYYNKPPQAGLIAHFTQVADASSLPVMLYDIPGRAGVALSPETITELAKHPQIVGYKDAKGDLDAAAELIPATGLLWFSGDDALHLAHLEQGAVGVVGVTSQVAPRHTAALVNAALAGDFAAANQAHQALAGLTDAVMNHTQGAITTKAALADLGLIPTDTLRLPLVSATAEERGRIATAITALVGTEVSSL